MAATNTKKFERFFLAFSPTLALCFLLQSSLQRQGENDLNPEYHLSKSLSRGQAQSSMCVSCGLQITLLTAKNQPKFVALQYSFAPGHFSASTPATLIEKLRVLSPAGNPVLFKLHNRTFDLSAEKTLSQLYTFQVSPGRYSISLNLFDIESEKTLHHRCSFTVHRNYKIQFYNKIPQDGRRDFYRV